MSRREGRFGPSDSPTYMYLYRNDPENRERMRESSRLYQQRRRAKVAAAQVQLATKALSELKQKHLLPDRRRGTDDDRLAARLRSIDLQHELLLKARELKLQYDITDEEALALAQDSILDRLDAEG